MPTTPAIAAHDLTKSYGDLLAVDRVSLRVDPGEVYALLGLNGAGKTTMIRMLLGMIRPTDGHVSMLGHRVRPGAHALWSRVGYLVETPVAYPELTVTENVHAAARLRRLPDPRAAVGDVITRLGLRPYADQRARTLSLGNAQRLGLAKALVHHPDLVILDEPANGLDPAGVAEIRDLLHDLAHRQGVAVVLSSHILTEVARLATRIGVIDHGRLVREIHTDDLATLAHPRLSIAARDNTTATEVLRAAGFSPEDTGANGVVVDDERAVRRPDDIAALLVNADCPPTRLVVEQDDLETYFLRVIGEGPR
ncbi:MAG: ABC transporter ATP-binding protein [Umezawaea sp.]